MAGLLQHPERAFYYEEAPVAFGLAVVPGGVGWKKPVKF